MDVIPLEHAAQVRLVHFARAQALNSGVLATKRLQEGVRKFSRIEGLFGQCRNGFFYFNRVHKLGLNMIFHDAGNDVVEAIFSSCIGHKYLIHAHKARNNVAMFPGSPMLINGLVSGGKSSRPI
jgi:hypothetical protein